MKNDNCDGDKCTSAAGEVRVLPTGGDSNAILCRSCFNHEMQFRRERNQDLADDCKFSLPAWETLRVYNQATLERTQMERGTGRGYRWTEGFYVIKPSGEKLFPPMLLREAREFCRRQGWTIAPMKGAKI